MHWHCGTNNRAPRWTFTDPCKPEVRTRLPGRSQASSCLASRTRHEFPRHKESLYMEAWQVLYDNKRVENRTKNKTSASLLQHHCHAFRFDVHDKWIWLNLPLFRDINSMALEWVGEIGVQTSNSLVIKPYNISFIFIMINDWYFWRNIPLLFIYET